MLPGFTDDGLLPSGDYELSLAELRSSLLVVGPGSSCPSWDSGWRARLVNNLEVMVKQLLQVGITEIFIDGSFVEDKQHPNDIDGYFECDLRSCFKIPQVSARQGENRRKSAAYTGVNEHFEPIFNDGLCRMRGF